MTTRLLGPALLGDAVVPNVLVTIDGDLFVSVEAMAAGADRREVTLVEGTMAPGFVDIHCHGGGGTSFTDLDPDRAAATARHHHAHGSTSVVASLVTMTPDDLLRGVEVLADLADDGLVEGIHLEGPWLAEARRGAHDRALLRDASPGEVQRLVDAGRGYIRQVTLAPERPGGRDLVKLLVSQEIHAAIGHTTASYGEVMSALDAGADLATHLFNGMDPWHHRTPGAVPALLAAAKRGEVTLELIADGTHLAEETVRAVVDLVGPGQVALVSDAMAAAGTGDGRYVLGGLTVLVDGGVARIEPEPDGTPGSIAGGTSHVSEQVQRAVASGIPLPYAARAASSTPARALGLSDRGALVAGHRADLLVVDADAQMTRVMRGGAWLP